MKRLFATLLTATLLFSLLIGSSFAATDTKTQTVKALGIITGDENGSLNLSSYVTRAEFAKMMVAASAYKDTVGTASGISLFKDVKSTHWAVEYISTGLNEGWFVGYVDGTFRPDQTVTLEEAASALLHLLGYSSDDLAGTYPGAQLAKFTTLKLNDGISTGQGSPLTRDDCVNIFYNLMTAQTKAGQTYATTLGYSLTESGELNYSSLVTANMSGPYVITSTGWSGELPFGTTNATVYKNGSAATLASAAQYDVYYYSSDLRTVWLYDSKVIGTYTAAAPSSAAPQQVTVAGNTYELGTSNAAYKLSTLGGFAVGDSVTLLLGMSGEVVDVVSSVDTESSYYGIVIGNSTESYTDNNGSVQTENTVRIACTDGTVRSYGVGSTTYTVGSVVEAAVKNGSVQITRLTKRGITGKVDSTASALGSYSLASDVQIIDVSDDGDYKVIHASRLAGYSLAAADIYYYALNTQGEISHLILDDATGDLYDYGVLTAKEKIEDTRNYTYSYIVNGSVGSITGLYTVDVGGALFKLQNNSIDNMRSLSSAALTSVSALTATAGGAKYTVASDVQVYRRSGQSYYLVNLSAVQDTTQYTLTGYYDSLGYATGGQIRVIVAVEK